ncbi:RNA polymerase I-associated factor PAF67-domain-containing protein [Lactarius pseudohatsudake]|nr:RNA polymerase I-associated factor PAF67-domain-containing protein [Lactarius pseudohatsudake]
MNGGPTWPRPSPPSPHPCPPLKLAAPTPVLLSAVKLARPIAYKGPPAFEELFLYACPKFISANPPPYGDPEQLALYTEEPPSEPVQHHLALFVANMRAQAAAPTLRSFLKLYTSLDAAKPAIFLDADEEEMARQMMAVKAASRSISRNMVHISEVTVGCRFAGWLIRNTEHTQRVLDGVKNGPLHLAPQPAAGSEAESKSAPTQQKKVAWQQRPRHSIRRCYLTLHVVQRGHGTVFPLRSAKIVIALDSEQANVKTTFEEITKCEAGRMFTSLALSNVSTSSGTIAANSEGPKRGRKGRCIAVDQSRARRSEVLRFLFLCSTA